MLEDFDPEPEPEPDIELRNCKKMPNVGYLKRVTNGGVAYKYTTANHAYVVDSLPCCTNPLQGHVEVLTSPSPSFGGVFCSLRFEPALVSMTELRMQLLYFKKNVLAP